MAVCKRICRINSGSLDARQLPAPNLKMQRLGISCLDFVQLVLVFGQRRIVPPRKWTASQMIADGLQKRISSEPDHGRWLARRSQAQIKDKEGSETKMTIVVLRSGANRRCSKRV